MKQFPVKIIVLATVFIAVVLITIVLLLRDDSKVPVIDGNYNLPTTTQTDPLPPVETYGASLPQGYKYTADKKDFDAILSSAPSRNFVPVLDSLYLDYYAITPCEFGGKGENVIRLVFDDSIASGKTMDEYERLVYIWESDMVRDIGDIIFPRITTIERNTLLQFSDTDVEHVRSAKINISGEPRTVYYAFLDNVFYIGSTIECIKTVEDTIWGPDHADHGDHGF